jgi:transposase
MTLNEVRSLIHEGKSISEIEKIINVSRYHIEQHIKQHKIPYQKQSTTVSVLCPDLPHLRQLIEVEGKRYQDCAEIFGVSHYKIWRWCEANNIKTTHQPHIKKEAPPIDTLKSEYESGLTFLDLGKKYNVSNVTVRKWFKEHNIPIRTHSETQKIGRVKLVERTGQTYFPPVDGFQPKWTSAGETEVKTFLNNLGFDFKKRRLNNGKMEVDLLDENLKIGVEFCGLQYHHEGPPNFRTRTYHYEKWKNCQDQGIRLFTIFDHEWEKRKPQIQNFLKSSLGKFERRFYAKDLEVRTCEDTSFLTNYHIQGAPNVQEMFGLYTKEEELMGVVAFGRHPRISTMTVLNRLCFKPEVQIVGGASKLIQNALTRMNTPEIITWSDNRWSTGGVYQNCGFTKEKDLGPDYFYVKNGDKVKSKQSMKKGLIGCPPDITEREFLFNQGWYRVWDCGKIRWRLIK